MTAVCCEGLTNCLSAASARASTPCACVVQLDMGPQRACIMSANRRATATACGTASFRYAVDA